MSVESTALRIADRAGFKEFADARALGYDTLHALVRSWRTYDEVYALAMAPDRPAVWPRGSEPR